MTACMAELNLSDSMHCGAGSYSDSLYMRCWILVTACNVELDLSDSLHFNLRVPSLLQT